MKYSRIENSDVTNQDRDEVLDRNVAVIKLKMYNQTKEVITMKESQLAMLEGAHIKTSAVQDESPGGLRKDIHDRYAKILEKKDLLKLDLIELRSEIAAIDTALGIMNSSDKVMKEALAVIKLRHIEDKSFIDIEYELNMSEASVRRRLKRGEKEFTRLLNLAS